ncbi:MAG: bifunctional 4-hydroxy-2-oxoglutarate aldolase/2-dehydro-3-deoxy-phosphogluconate aldolase [Pedobacter sp.]|nr:MAG: bifunctional 4-hydroxy-2-oxoglutarate aldolase/2-dehydro-3-deoxy-phosphogluconate aldolase [Pedobacter sp.]
MENQATIIEAIKKQGVLPLFFHADIDTSIGIVKTLYDAGIRVIEFTNRGEQALANFTRLIEERDKSMPGLLLAVGTIRNADQASKFMKAGADFLISPVFDAEVCDFAYLNKLLWIPGCMTPTEVHVAENAGCKLVKLFPGNVLGPGFMSAIKELFPNVNFMPTGGVDVTEESIGDWFKSGVCAVGLGSKLITKKVMEDRNYTFLTDETKKALAIVAKVKL